MALPATFSFCGRRPLWRRASWRLPLRHRRYARLLPLLRPLARTAEAARRRRTGEAARRARARQGASLTETDRDCRLRESVFTTLARDGVERTRDDPANRPTTLTHPLAGLSTPQVVEEDGFRTVFVLRLAPILPLPLASYPYIYGARDYPSLPEPTGDYPRSPEMSRTSTARPTCRTLGASRRISAHLGASRRIWLLGTSNVSYAPFAAGTVFGSLKPN